MDNKYKYKKFFYVKQYTNYRLNLCSYIAYNPSPLNH